MAHASWLVVLCASLAMDAAAEDVGFRADIVPLLKSRCVMCHLPGAEQGGLALHPKGAYANLIDVKSTQSPLVLVSPGNPENSYLYRKLTGTHLQAGGSGERMPFGDASLSEEDLDRVRRWIEGGAKP